MSLRQAQVTEILSHISVRSTSKNIGAGVDFKTVQTCLGHADVSLTINIHAHHPRERWKAVDLIASITGTQKAPAVKAKRGKLKKTA
jgi:integrase